MDEKMIIDGLNEIEEVYKRRTGNELPPDSFEIILTYKTRDVPEFDIIMSDLNIFRMTPQQLRGSQEVVMNYDERKLKYDTETHYKAIEYFGGKDTFVKELTTDSPEAMKKYMECAVRAGCDTEFPWDDFIKEMKDALR